MLVELVALRYREQKIPTDQLPAPRRGQVVISTSMHSHRDWMPNPSTPTTVAIFTPEDGGRAMKLIDAVARELTEAGALLILGMEPAERWKEYRQAWACRPARGQAEAWTPRAPAPAGPDEEVAPFVQLRTPESLT